MSETLYRMTCACFLVAGLPFATAAAPQDASGQTKPAPKKPAAAGTPAQTPAKPPGASTAAPSANSGTVAYTDLRDKKASLPYGEPFTITGATAQVQLAGGSLDSLLAVQTVSGDYTTSDGTKAAISPAPVNGGAWSVTIGKLVADTSVTINFQFTGVPSADLQEAAASQMFADPAYQAAVSQFVKAAQGKASAEQMGAAALLAQAATDVLTGALARKGLTPKDPAGLKTSLTAAMIANIEPIFNLGEEYGDLQNPVFGVPGIVGMQPKDFTALSIQQLHARFTDKSQPPGYAKLSAPLGEQVKIAVDAFVLTYANAMAGLEGVLKSAAFNGSSSLAVGNDSQSDVVSDLKKYAGFDVGALYSYRLSEIRSFAMVHIYFGPVQLKTDAPPLKPGFGERLRQRTSLAFGMALKDISGATNSKISSQNAFIYGLGVRLNKYFRITAGGLLYRTKLPAVAGTSNAANGTLRHEFFIGPSIDVTALSALQSIFAKAKSN